MDNEQNDILKTVLNLTAQMIEPRVLPLSFPFSLPAPAGIRISAVVAHRLLPSVRDVASHGRQPLQGIIGLLLFSVLGALGDLGLTGEAFHPLLREGGADQVGGQLLQGSLRPWMDPGARVDLEPGVPPVLHHPYELTVDLAPGQEHPQHLQARRGTPGLSSGISG